METIYNLYIQKGNDKDYENLNSLLVKYGGFQFELYDPSQGQGSVITAGVSKYFRIKKKTRKTIFELAAFLLTTSQIGLNVLSMYNYQDPVEHIKVEQTTNNTYNIVVQTEDQIHELKKVTLEEATTKLDSLAKECE